MLIPNRVAYFWCYGVWVWGLGCGYVTTVTYFSETHFHRPIFEKRATEMGRFRKFRWRAPFSQNGFRVCNYTNLAKL